MPRNTQLRLAGVVLAGVFALFSISNEAIARSLTWARAADAPTLDPHAFDSGVALSLMQQIYEPLVMRDAVGKTVPALAESWGLTTDPLVWELRLRRGVNFHDGTPFTAEDVIFSIDRARQAGSGVAHLLAGVDRVAAVDSHVVRISTRGPTPLLPASLTHVLMMSKAWSEKNGAAKVAAGASAQAAHTFLHANGTGPFLLVTREAGQRTVMRRNDAYWGRAAAPVEISDLIYRVIPNDTERVEALVSGEVDFVQDVPVNELPRLQANKALHVNTGPQNLSVFIGLNVAPPAPNEAGVPVANPLSDRRVREAISAAINRQAIQRSVLLGQAIPTGTVAPPSINGYPRQLDKFAAHDVNRAKALLAEAGFANGFRLKLDCPRDGYTRSEAICRTVATQLAQAGINVEPVVRGFDEHIALLRSDQARPDAFLLGMRSSTFDSEQLLSALFHTRTDAAGQLNLTGYSNPDLDRLIGNIVGQVDFSRRSQTIGQAWQIAQQELIYVPLHVQTVAYAMKSDVSIAVDIENQPELRQARFKTTLH
jgi:peptide/nickel transport system substrate-binding protein